MKLFLEKVVPCIKHKKPDFRKSAARCLHQLHIAAPEAFNARMRKRTAEEQRDVTGVLAPLIPGFSIGGTVDTAPLHKPRTAARKAPVPTRGSPAAAATVIQSVARGRRGRKLSMEMRRHSLEGEGETETETAQCDQASRTTADDASDDEAAALQEKLRQYRAAKQQKQQQEQQQKEQPAAESRKQKQKPAVPRQKPVARKAEPTSAMKKAAAPAPTQQPVSEHPLFAHKPAPDTGRLEQLEEEVASLRRTGSASPKAVHMQQEQQPEAVPAAQDVAHEEEEVVEVVAVDPAIAEAEAADARKLAMQMCAEEISRRADEEDTSELLQNLRELCDLVLADETSFLFHVKTPSRELENAQKNQGQLSETIYSNTNVFIC
jgi:hypothetical protein